MNARTSSTYLARSHVVIPSLSSLSFHFISNIYITARATAHVPLRPIGPPPYWWLTFHQCLSKRARVIICTTVPISSLISHSSILTSGNTHCSESPCAFSRGPAPLDPGLVPLFFLLHGRILCILLALHSS